jgi:hypothetical protein
VDLPAPLAPTSPSRSVRATPKPQNPIFLDKIKFA